MLDVLLFLFLHSCFCCTCTTTIKGFSTLFCSVTLINTSLSCCTYLDVQMEELKLEALKFYIKQQKQTTTRIQLFQIKLQQTTRETKTESSSVTAMFPVLRSPARMSTLCCSEQTGCTAMLTSGSAVQLQVNRFNTTVSYCRTFYSSAHLTASHGLMLMSSVSLLRKHLN